MEKAPARAEGTPKRRKQVPEAQLTLPVVVPPKPVVPVVPEAAEPRVSKAAPKPGSREHLESVAGLAQPHMASKEFEARTVGSRAKDTERVLHAVDFL
jgi:hypothetical protein